MQEEMILSAFTKGWENKSYETIQAWAQENIELPASAFAVPGYFSTDRSKYMNAVFDALRNPKVRTVSVSKAVQSGGSLIAQVFLPWAMLNKSGILLYLTQGDESAKILAETRIHPILRTIPEFKSVLGRQSKYALKNMTINLDTVNVLIRGAKEKFVQSNSCLVVIGDEVWLWKDGIMEQARSRTAKFPLHKILWISQPSEIDTEWHTEYHKGMQFEWNWCCPKCEFVQPYYWDKQREDKTWAGVIWNKIKDGERTDIFKTAATAKIECYKCRHQITDTPTNRKALMDNSRYVCTNLDGDPSRLSFTWNSMASVDIPIAYDPKNPGPSLVVEYLQAKEQQKIGNLIPFKNFWQQKLAKWWDETNAERQYIVAMSGYDVKSDWAEEKNRVMTVDCQKDHTEFWCLVRAWNNKAESRLLYFGKVDTWEEVEGKQKEYNVPDQLVFVDSGYLTSKVYSECVKRGHIVKLPNGQKQYVCWSATKGSASRDFQHNDPNKPADRRIYAKKQWADPMYGKANDGKPKYKCPLWVYSTNSVKDILRKYRDGKGPTFLVPKDDETYNKMMNSEVLRKVKDKKTGKDTWVWVKVRDRNEAWDLEGMQILVQILLENIRV